MSRLLPSLHSRKWRLPSVRRELSALLMTSPRCTLLAGGLAWSITSCSLRQCYPILDALVDSMAIAQEFRMLCLGKKMQVASSPPARRWGALGSSGLSKQPGHDRRLLCRQPPLPFALFLALFLELRSLMVSLLPLLHPLPLVNLVVEGAEDTATYHSMATWCRVGAAPAYQVGAGGPGSSWPGLEPTGVA